MSFRKGQVADKDRYDDLKFLTASPSKKDFWGCMSPLKGTAWEKEIPVVNHLSFQEALLGWSAPLRKELGTPPGPRARRLPVVNSFCEEYLDSSCMKRTENCRPGTGSMPSCYSPPFEDMGAKSVGVEVARAWDEGRYVFVVRGAE